MNVTFSETCTVNRGMHCGQLQSNVTSGPSNSKILSAYLSSMRWQTLVQFEHGM